VKALAVIPTRYEPQRLAALVACVETDVLVLDNGHEPPLDAVDARGLGIYAMWNRGWDTARERGYGAVALLNDDIRILPGTITVMAEALAANPTAGVVYPDWPLPLSAGLPSEVRLEVTEGTVTSDGMTGFAFMFRTDLPVPPFVEGYGWWYGDDAFERSVRRSGYEVCRIVGLPCEHESDSERDNWARRPELREVTERDRARWERQAVAA
jgi:hypothetical protein